MLPPFLASWWAASRRAIQGSIELNQRLARAFGRFNPVGSPPGSPACDRPLDFQLRPYACPGAQSKVFLFEQSVTPVYTTPFFGRIGPLWLCALWEGHVVKPIKKMKRKLIDSKAFLATVDGGRRLLKCRKGEPVFSQGDPADAVFYIQEGKPARRRGS
jgi:hypothetical protein